LHLDTSAERPRTRSTIGEIQLAIEAIYRASLNEGRLITDGK
jgi:hypothetical protein